MFGDVVSVELPLPAGLMLEEEIRGGADHGESGLVVGGMSDGGAAERSGLVRVGDELLAIGPIDVEGMALEHALEILERWPDPTVPLQMLRERE